MFFNIKLVFYQKTNKLVKKDSAYYYFKKGSFYSESNKADLAFKSFLKSLHLYNNKVLLDSVAECNLRIFVTLDSQKGNLIEPLTYLKKYEKYALENNDTTRIIISDLYHGSYFYQKSFSKSRTYFLNGLKRSEEIKNEIYQATFFSNLGSLNSNYDTLLDSKLHQKAIIIYKKYNLNNKLFQAHLNLAGHYFLEKDYKKAIQELKIAEEINLDKYKNKSLRILYDKFAKYYQYNTNYKKANNYFLKSDSLKNILQNSKQNTSIVNIKEKYDNVGLREEIIKNKNFLIASLLFILLAGTTATLSLKNSKRKRKLAEQEKELETQKNLTLLKEQEITTINAMVDGQEKERKRIAEDLHDNLGSVLATLKLHFENLKINREKKKINQETLFDKTENLIDEAYLKVRRIAHAKNAGVIANQGLLMAVQMMAEKISSADKIKIEVVHFGLDKRLENTLELSVFRIIQELVTNIIKHAEAKNATINISLYEKILNIIIEDDGKGFNINKIDLKNGMGISSIKTRVEHLKGTFEIDSTLGKGSSIILDIPVN